MPPGPHHHGGCLCQCRGLGDGILAAPGWLLLCRLRSKSRLPQISIKKNTSLNFKLQGNLFHEKKGLEKYISIKHSLSCK